jgi:hypothetical protein
VGHFSWRLGRQTDVHSWLFVKIIAYFINYRSDLDRRFKKIVFIFGFIQGHANCVYSGSCELCLYRVMRILNNSPFSIHDKNSNMLSLRDTLHIMYYLFPHTPRCCILILSKFFIHQLMHKWAVLKKILKFTLKFTLKQLRHVSVQSLSSGSALLELAEVTVVKIIN